MRCVPMLVETCQDVYRYREFSVFVCLVLDSLATPAHLIMSGFHLYCAPAQLNMTALSTILCPV